MEYKATQDTFGAFLTECTVVVPKVKTKVGDLFTVWRDWCERTGERPGRTQDFSSSLEEHDITLQTYQGAKYVLDLGIVVNAGQVSDQEEWEVGEVR